MDTKIDASKYLVKAFAKTAGLGTDATSEEIQKLPILNKFIDPNNKEQIRETARFFARASDTYSEIAPDEVKKEPLNFFAGLAINPGDKTVGASVTVQADPLKEAKELGATVFRKFLLACQKLGFISKKDKETWIRQRSSEAVINSPKTFLDAAAKNKIAA